MPILGRARPHRPVITKAVLSSVALAAGSASLSTKGTTTASLTATDATGGTPAYTYQWEYRTPSGSGSYGNYSGATSLTLNATGLTDATSYDFRLKYTDAAAGTATSNTVTFRTDVAPNNAAIFAVPEVCKRDATSAIVCDQGNLLGILKVTVGTGESVSATFDTTRLNGLTAGTTPTICVEMDDMLLDLNGDGLFYKQLTNGANSQTITFASPSAGNHVFKVYVRSTHTISGETPGRWGTGGAKPPGCVELVSYTLGTNSTLGSLTPGTDYPSLVILFVGDSVTVGVLAALASGSTVTTASAANNDTRKAWPSILCTALQAVPVFIAQGGLGYTTQSGTFQGGSTVNPGLDTTNGAGENYLTHHYNGAARSWTTSFYAAVVQCGPNDGGSLTTTVITNVLAYLRTNLGASAWLFQSVEAAQRTRSTQTSALASPQDSKTKLLDSGFALYGTSAASTYSPDASHMNAEGHARDAATKANLIRTAIAGAGGSAGGGSVFGGSVIRGVAG